VRFNRIFGIDFKSAPIDIREKYFLSRSHIDEIYRAYNGSATDFFILSTCDRTGIFVFDTETDAAPILEVESSDNRYFTSRYGADAGQYVFRLLLGMESHIYGEAEVRNQIKDALTTAYTYNALSKGRYTKFMQWIEKVERQVALLGISAFQTELYGRFLRRIMREYITDEVRSAAVLGTGYIAEKILDMLSYTDVKTKIFSNKNERRALYLAVRFNSAYDKMENIYRAFADFDMIFSATAAPHRIIKASKLKSGSKRQIFIDFSFPRDIDPSVNELDGKVVLQGSAFRGDFLSGSEHELLNKAYNKLRYRKREYV